MDRISEISALNNVFGSENLTKSSEKEFVNTIMPEQNKNSDKLYSPKTSLSPEETLDVVSGTYKGDKVQAFGITHYRYKDCAPADLTDIGGGIKIHKKCASAFRKMQQAAAKDGVALYIVSGYRSSKYQVTVFKKKFADKNYPTQSEMKSRLRFSAPSGFSEHHTGLAIDINSTSQSFANTKMYKWLEEHAAEYGFELSFPKNGHQGLGFEPWHWRYVGDDETKAVFAQARNQQ